MSQAVSEAKSEAQQTADLNRYFSKRFPDNPQLVADATALHLGLGWTPPPEGSAPEGPALERPGLEGAAPAAAPAARRRIDWGEAARLLAAGSSIEEAARRLRCDPQAIRRNLRRSRRFRLRIESEHAHCRLTAQLRFGALGDYAINHLKLQSGNPRLLQWLGDRLGLGALASSQAGGLAMRFQAALHPGQRIPSADEEAQRALDAREVKQLIDEAKEWHQARRPATGCWRKNAPSTGPCRAENRGKPGNTTMAERLKPAAAGRHRLPLAETGPHWLALVRTGSHWLQLAFGCRCPGGDKSFYRGRGTAHHQRR